MAQQYLVDIGMHDSLDDIIRKCNHNFRTMSSSQKRQSRNELRTGINDLDEAINAELTTMGDRLTEEAEIRLETDVHLQGEIDEIIAEGGTSDYNRLRNKPSIEDVQLIGNKTFPQLGIFIDSDEDMDGYPDSDMYALTVQDINALWNGGL